MIRKNRCIAMLLAGGQGSRLHVLTKNIAKPAVPFGAKYRIIDFTLSNCINSDINVVGVPTQYQPLVLNRYISTTFLETDSPEISQFAKVYVVSRPS